MVWESLSADMSGEEVVVVQIMEDEFRLVRKTVEGENEEILTTLNKREALFLSDQLDDAVLAYERGDTDED